MFRHYEESITISASPIAVFTYADDHKNFSSHMNKSSWMMGGGKMETHVDEGNGQKLSSHIKMHGKIFGVKLFLDEVITQYEPPNRKAWKTVGDINLLIIGYYTLGFTITTKEEKSLLNVYIDYDLPNSFFGYLLGLIFGELYAKWCVHQMITGVKEHFNTLSSSYV